MTVTPSLKPGYTNIEESKAILSDLSLFITSEKGIIPSLHA
jgi:hypothetical protein